MISVTKLADRRFQRSTKRRPRPVVLGASLAFLFRERDAGQSRRHASAERKPIPEQRDSGPSSPRGTLLLPSLPSLHTRVASKKCWEGRCSNPSCDGCRTVPMTSEVRLAGMRHCASLEAVRAWVSSNATCHRATIRSERAANAAQVIVPPSSHRPTHRFCQRGSDSCGAVPATAP